MLTVTAAQLNGWVSQFLWPFVRILALFGTAPVFSMSNLPNRVKIGLAVAITFIVAPTLGPLPDVAVGSAAGLWITAQQVLIGVSLGFVMQVVFAAVQGTGEFVGLQMGLSFANLVTTSSDGSTLALGQMFNVLATLVFLAIDGHLRLIATLVGTFHTLPPGGEIVVRNWQQLANWGATVFTAGLMLSLPLVAALLIANLALGILNRAAPQVGVFQVGFAVTLTVGFLVLQLVLPNMLPFLTSLFNLGFSAMQQFGMPIQR
jgi:flagellar biosynthetic protein FliR